MVPSVSAMGGGGGGSTPASSELSYGLNAHFTDSSGLHSRNKILLADYDHLTVTETDVWGPAPSFARHSGRMNVLFRDGRVSLMPPAAIDPMVPSLADQYWKP